MDRTFTPKVTTYIKILIFLFVLTIGQFKIIPQDEMVDKYAQPTSSMFLFIQYIALILDSSKEKYSSSVKVKLG